MKKLTALVLTALLLALLLTVPALAEEDASLYGTLLNLLEGRSWTLTAAVADAQLEEDDVIPFEAASLSLEPAEGEILITGCLNGETVLTASVTAEGFAFACGLITAEPQQWTWAELPPTVAFTEKEDGFSLQIRATGSLHEIIDFSLELDGSLDGDYAGEAGFTLLMSGGEICGLWDTFSSENGETESELIISLVHEVILTAEGTEEAAAAEDGSLILSRTEACEVVLDDNDAGTVTLLRRLVRE